MTSTNRGVEELVGRDEVVAGGRVVIANGRDGSAVEREDVSAPSQADRPD
jgi:hypothetical protein